MPAEYYLETIQTVFQEYRLPNGSWEVEGKPVRPQDIKTVALFTIEGELDDISGPGQTQAAHALCSLARGRLSAGARLHPQVFLRDLWDALPTMAALTAAGL